jgi:hypothetical protein
MSYIILRGRLCHIIVLNIHAPTEDKTDDVKASFYEELERVFDKFPKYHMKILLGDFNAKVGREDIFKPTIRNKNLHEISIDNKVRLVKFAICKTSQSKVQRSHNATSIHKYNWTSPDVKTDTQIDHILVERRRHSNGLNALSFTAADCNTGHYLVVGNVRERLTVNKEGSHRFHMEMFNLKKLNEVEGKDKYRIEVSKMFAALEDLDAEVDINSA